MDAAIVVACYDRPHALSRLLRSLAAACLPPSVPLVLSVDGGGDEQVARLAREFCWPHGRKDVVIRERRHGLREHLLLCGDLASLYGGVLLLEDDLYVGRHFHDFVAAAASFYADDSRIAGISLYSPRYNETAAMGWRAYDDGSDVFFMQVPSSWGQYWSAAQWQGFRNWYRGHEAEDPFAEGVPANVLRWPDTSWKKYFFRYMVATDRYFVYPRVSHTTNFTDTGVHHRAGTLNLQVPLQTFVKRLYRLTTLDESMAVYDAYCEIRPDLLKRLAPRLACYSFAVDLYGTKDLSRLREPLVLTCRSGPGAIERYARALTPHEMNVIMDISGDDMSLVETARCDGSALEVDAERLRYYYGVPTRVLVSYGRRLLEAAMHRT